MLLLQGPAWHFKEVLDRLNAATPFTSCRQGKVSVIAFEVEWQQVVGLDYVNPLCQDGRVVLEAHNIIKREFKSVRISFLAISCGHAPKGLQFVATLMPLLCPWVLYSGQHHNHLNQPRLVFFSILTLNGTYVEPAPLFNKSTLHP